MSPSNSSAQFPVAKGVLAVIDAFSLFFKAYYAIRGLTNEAGMPTNGLFGFVKMMQKLLSERKPDYVTVALDSPTPTFRAQIYPQYKANRPEPPADLLEQIPWLKRILEAWGLAAVQCDGFEADDVIGCLARRAERQGLEALIVSADKDLFQLVTERVRFLRFQADDMEVYGPREIHARLGVWPHQVPDYLALVGDSSDNIPGVPRIGPKTAVQLLGEFQDLDALFSGLDRIKNARQRALLEQGRDSARLSKRLATIEDNLPLPIDWNSLRWDGKMSTPELNALFRELGFKSLVVEPVQSPAKGPQAAKASYSTLRSEEELEGFAARARKAPILAVDTETTAVDPMRAELVGISLSVQPAEAVYVPIGHRFPGENKRQPSLEAVGRILGPVLADPGVPKTGQNIKYDLKALRRAGLTLQGIAFDTSLASYLLDPGEEHGLKSMSKRLLGVEQTPISQLIGAGKGQITMAEVPIDAAADYACQDADFTLRLTDRLGAELAEAGLDGLMRNLELPLIEILADMEMEGIRLDVGRLAGLARQMRERLGALTREIHEAAGHAFNINSSKQVATVLFEEIGLKPVKTGKTGYSTDLSVLEKLAGQHPLARLLVEYRAYEKLLSTYVEPLPAMVHPETGRLHCSFSQTITATGRLSCHDPNLQNIPVRTELGREIRRAFLPNRPGEVLLAADYSQIELRILAHLSGDKELVEAFRQNQDIHRLTAAKIFGCVPEMVTDEMRSQAKVVNFGILYGMSATRLADEFGISRPAAQRFIDEYFAAYPGVKAWTQAVIEEGREAGSVKTLSGRIRRVPDLRSRSSQARRAAERIAVNTPVQGAAADMIKMAMIGIHRRLRGSKLQARMLLQIHDELVFSTPADEAEQLAALAIEEMESALPLNVPVRVDVATGANWAEC